MLRILAETAVFFAAPFALYLVFLAVSGHSLFDIAHWSRTRFAHLTLAGLCACVAGMLALGIAAPRGTGAYSQAHIENGRLVPGKIE